MSSPITCCAPSIAAPMLSMAWIDGTKVKKGVT